MRTSVPNTYILPGGLRLRVRLPQANDRAELAALAQRTGTPLEVESLLRFDPRRRTVLVAGSWIGSRMVVGVVAVDRLLPGDPEILVGDEELAPGVTALLAEVAARDIAARERFAA